jgi:hypothetical protein
VFQTFIHTETINLNLLWGIYLRHPINKGVVTRVACHSVCMSPLTHFIHITSSSSANWGSVWKNVILKGVEQNMVQHCSSLKRTSHAVLSVSSTICRCVYLWKKLVFKNFIFTFSLISVWVFFYVNPRTFGSVFILFYLVVYMSWILSYKCRRYIIRQRRVGTVRWHQCSYCSKEFKKPSDLVRHIRIHTHERPYKVTGHSVQRS